MIKRIEIARLWENHYWDTKVYAFNLEPDQNEPDDATILKVVNADAFDILGAFIWNLDPDDPDDTDDTDAGDDLCDYCLRSGLQISHTLDGKTICDDCLGSRTPDPDWEPVELEMIEMQIDGLQLNELLSGQTVEDLSLRYEGHAVDHVLIGPEETTIFWYVTLGDDDEQHHASVASDQPVFYITVPKE